MSRPVIERMPAPLIGVNVPWLGNGYGHDLGRNAAYPTYPTFYDVHGTRRLLEVLRGFGVQLLRIWLFEDGEGLTIDDAARVKGLDPSFRYHLAELVDLLAELGFRVYWAVLDANSVARRDDTITRSILLNAEQAARFVDCAFSEVLEVVAGITWGVDLCNEPEAVIAGSTGNNTGLGFRWCELQPSLRVLRQAVTAALPWTSISIGSGYREQRNVAAGLFERLELDLTFLDYHCYATEAPVHAGSLATSKQVVLGELGITVRNEQQRRSTWARVQQQLLLRLHSVLASSYAAIFLWYVSDLEQSDAHGLIRLNEPSPVLHSLRGLEAAQLIRLCDG